MISGGMKCSKYFLFVFNLLFFIAGLALIITGALVETTFSKYFEFFNGRVNYAAIFLIFVGCIVFIVAFFGCCGAVKENYCMIVTYACLLVLVTILEVAVGLTAYYARGELEEKLDYSMLKAIGNYSLEDGHNRTWDMTQRHLKCCGVKTPADWVVNINLNATKSVPDSCCVVESVGCGTGKRDEPAGLIYQEGCTDRLKAILKEKAGLLAGVAISLAIFQILGLVLSICLAYAIRKEYKSV